MKLFLLLLVSTFLYSSSLEKVSIQFNWKYQFEVAGFIAANAGHTNSHGFCGG